MTSGPKRFNAGAAIDREKCVYVVRPEDDQYINNLSSGNHCNLHAGRQTGKTTLMIKAIEELRRQGHCCLDVELMSLPKSLNFIEFIDGLVNEIRKKIPEFVPWESAPKSTREALSVLLEQMKSIAPENRNIYLFLDEMDHIRRYAPNEVSLFFEVIRGLENRQQMRPLIVSLVSVLTPNEFTMEYETEGIGSAFGVDMFLPCFDNNKSVVDALLEGFPDDDPQALIPLIHRILTLTGGHPYMTILLCQDIAYSEDRSGRMVQLETELPSKARTIVTEHIIGLRKQLLAYKYRIYKIADVYKNILSGTGDQSKYSPDDVASLENIGLIRIDNQGRHVVANPIYAGKCQENWINGIVDEYDQLKVYSKFKIRHYVSSGIQKKRIAIVHTGGTFGMTIHGQKTRFVKDYKQLFEPIEEQLNSIGEIVHFPKYSLDGINITPDHWVGIIEEILRIRMLGQGFDAFVVTHGTDTISITASAVAFAFGSEIDFPIIFTGSQTTLDIPHGDTGTNLIRACFAAGQSDPEKIIREVAISFDDLVFRACRAQKIDDQRYDGFSSPAWPPLARITQEFKVNKGALYRPAHAQEMDCRPYFADAILSINIVPGLQPDFFFSILRDPNVSVDGVVITTPGAGNIPSDPKYNFRNFILESCQRNIPVLITSQVPINPYTTGFYDVANAAVEAGAIPAANITPSAALAKFYWVIGNVKHEIDQGKALNKMKEIKERMRHIYIGEEGEYGEPFER